MSEVTVNQLADVVGTPVERLLKQMNEAGLSHSNAEEAVSEDDKKTLLAFLKNIHGVEDTAPASPRKITLKRKTVSTLKSTSSQGRRSVNVEVRKKRTYVKRDTEEQPIDAEVLPGEPEDAAPVIENAEAVGASELLGTAQQTEASAQAAASQDDSPKDVDPEAIRQAAIVKRIEEEQRVSLEREKADHAREESQSEAAALAVSAKAEEAPGEQKKVFTKTAKRADSAKPDFDEDKPRKKTSRLKDKSLGLKNKRQHNIKLSDNYDEMGQASPRSRRRKVKMGKASGQKKHGFERPTETAVHDVEIPASITPGDLAQKMNIKVAAVIKIMMGLGTVESVNEPIDQETASLIVEELGHKPVLISSQVLEDDLLKTLNAYEGELKVRAPVVSVMGHVDHGKTSLLDYIRKAKVADSEAGGITQHIGAYHVDTDHGMITFLDTPGHAAFSAMRARGATSTDIVILVVAADDGVMPQTVEAVQHARAAEMPLIVAVNKMDKEGADPDRVKNELAAKDVIPEDWGGDVQFVPVSAHTGEGIDDLLTAISLQAEMLELQAAADCPAQGVVVEASLDKGRGSVATVLVQNGTLNKGDIILAGCYYGRVRAMLDENGKVIDSAGPAIPVEVLGIDGTPSAGDDFAVIDSEKRAREIAKFREEKAREIRQTRQQIAKLENMFENLGAEKSSLNVVLKTDVRGSLEAVQAALLDLGDDEVSVNIVSSGVGGITETDINLAITSGAVVFGFNVRAEASARNLIEVEGVDLRYYSIIYNLIDDVRDALSGMLSPELREEIVGTAEVREIFKSPKFGLVAGSMVIEGTLYRSKPIRVLRDDIVIYEGELESLRRFRDDVEDVRNGTECGIGVKNYTDVKVGDKIEVFEMKEYSRSL